MSNSYSTVPLEDVIRQRNEFIEIDDFKAYKRCRVQLHAHGIVLRDVIQGTDIKTKKQQVCHAGEFLVAEIDAKVGGFGVVPNDLDGAVVSSHYFLFDLDEDVLNRRFLEYFVRTPAFMEQVKAQGTTNYAAIRPGDVLGYKIPLPSLEEQRRIVARIEELAARIEEARGLREEAVEEAEALFVSLITQRLQELPVNGSLGEVLLGKPRNGWSARCDNEETGIPVLTLSAVTGFHYRETEFKRTAEPTFESAHYWLHPGDLLITRSNTPNLVGHAAIYNGSPSPCIYPDLMMRLEVNEQIAYKRFVHYWLRSVPVREYIRKTAKGTSPTMKKISQVIVMNIPFPSSLSLQHQHQMVGYMDELDQSVNKLKQLQSETTAELDALLPSILDKAFKGDL